ncbi:MAG: helix-turn-helix transcriptional regulator [Litorimonas sp.]
MSVTIDRDVLRVARDKYLWTQEDLAAASGLSVRTIQRIEARGKCSKDSLQALLAALDIMAVDIVLNETVLDESKNCLRRKWILGPALGSVGGLTGCFIASLSLTRNIRAGQIEMSLALSLTVFLTVATIYSVCFPAFMTYYYKNKPRKTCAVPREFIGRKSSKL